MERGYVKNLPGLDQEGVAELQRRMLTTGHRKQCHDLVSP